MFAHSARSRLDKLLEQDNQLGSSMDLVTTQMNELATVVHRLPIKLDHVRPNAITIYDPFGNNTMFPLTPVRERTAARHYLHFGRGEVVDAHAGNYIAVCGEARARLDGDDDELWAESVVPGRTIRLSYLGRWKETGPGSVLSKVLQFMACPDHERDAGPM